MNVPAPSFPPGSGGDLAAGAAGGAAARALAAAAAKAAAQQAAAPPVQPVEAAPFPPDEIRDRCEKMLARYPTKMAALLPVLHIAQAHYDGWISPEVEAGVAAYLGISPAHVRGVLTFYSMYHTEPRGRHEVWVCRTLTCWLRGAAKLADLAREKAGPAREDGTHWHTGEDGKFTVMEMECIGLCEVAPAVFIDGEPHVEVKPEQFSKLLDECE